MTIESWIALGASLLLVLSLVAEGLRQRQARGHWGKLATGLEIAAVLASLAALILALIAGNPRSPDNLRLVAWGLALSILGTHLVLTWLIGSQCARPTTSLLALAALILGITAPAPGASLLGCPQLGAAFTIQWFLFLLGAGSVIVAGSAGLEILLAAGLSRTGRFSFSHSRDALPTLVAQGALLGLVVLGAGLAAAAWWAWQVAGTLTSRDPRELWMAITWLVTATSLLAWQLETRAGRWAGILATIAAAFALGSLLVAPLMG